MLAQLENPTNDFFALARYLINGRENPPNPKRVAWIMAHNLGTEDALLAATYMTATAEMSKRCRSACYHAMIAWRRDEQPSPEVMQEIARKTLEMAGLADHQALVVGHGDKAHPHLHMMINRVHPETGRAWSTSHDYRRFDRIMRDLSEAYGFAYVPPHRFHPELTDALPKAPNSAALFAARGGAGTDRPQWSRTQSRAFGSSLSEKLDKASSWDDIERAFAETGLSLETKGQGLIVGNSRSYSKFSALRLTTSAKGLERKHGSFSAHRSSRKLARFRPWTVDEVDIARALGTQSQLRDAINAAKARKKAWLSKAGYKRQLEEELKEALRPNQHPGRSTR